MKFQLVYAVGEPLPLPNLDERFAAISGALRALLFDPAVAGIIAAQNLSISRKVEPAAAASASGGGGGGGEGAPCSAGAFFAELRLLPGDDLERVMPQLRVAIARFILANPPHELRWLKGSQHYENAQSDILRFVTDEAADADSIIAPSRFSRESHRAGLLALRGLLGFGTLAHCLSKRHGVEYGVDRRDGRKKRLAVPFRACDEPSERAEYAHPDTALVFTTLSYYYDGLSGEEVMAAFEKLQELGEANQHARYSAWFEAARPGLTEEEAKALDDVRKLDLTNAVQVKQLKRAFRLNCGVIDFWLMSCVLPTETVR